MILCDRASSALNTEAFILEEVMFNLMYLIRDSETPLILKSSNSKVIIAQSAPQYPAWIWTDNCIEEEELNELAEEFYRVFSNSPELCFVAKPSIVNFLQITMLHAKIYRGRLILNWNRIIARI